MCQVHFHTMVDSVIHDCEHLLYAGRRARCRRGSSSGPDRATVQKSQATGPSASSPLPKLMQHVSFCLLLPSHLFGVCFSSEIYKLPSPGKNAFAHRCSVLDAVSDMDPRRL